MNELDIARTPRLACGLMPEASLLPGDGEPVRSDVPVLLLNGAEDPQDPRSNVADAGTELPNSLSIAVPALGHTVGHVGCLPRSCRRSSKRDRWRASTPDASAGWPAPFVTPPS